MKPCRVDGCERRARKNGLCSGHNLQGENSAVAPRFPSDARDEDGHKRCCRCERWLDTSLFSKDIRAPSGLRSLCRECHAKRQRVLKYGVSEDWFDSTLSAQGGRCAICQSSEHRGQGWAIDHDHACCTDKATSCGQCIRGILCSPCNLALGLFGDRAEVINAAASYLTAHSRQPERMSLVRGV